MKLLLDQNLSRFLVDHLKEAYPDSAHVTSVDLDRATDRQVWEYASANGFTIVSKDTDFNDMAVMLGPRPEVVWLRVGNATTATIESVLLDAHDAITQFADNAEDAVLVLRVTSPASENDAR